MRLASLLAILLVSTSVFAQLQKAGKYAKTITTDDLRTHLSILASDSLEGRETGKSGQKKAAKYLAAQFEAFGLEAPVKDKSGATYLQKFDLEQGTWREIYLTANDRKFSNLEHFLYFSRTETRGEEYHEIIFTGDASTLNQYNLAGKFVATTNADMMQLTAEIQKQGGAGLMLIIEDPDRLQFSISRFGGSFNRPIINSKIATEGAKVVAVDTVLSSHLFGKPFTELKPGDEAEFILNADMIIKPLSSENVLGFIPGDEKPGEVLVLTSHYDHLGIRDGEIYNGADDDASGTSVILELAEAYALATKKGQRPARSILFMCVSGEEKGLLGSEYYVNNPVYPLAQTVVNLNIDMVGRVDAKHKENPDYVYLIGSDRLSDELHDLSERVNKETLNLSFDYTYNDEDDPNRYYYRSDHYNFAKNDIPVIFYFNGTHEDYHRPSDTIEKINFEKMSKIAKLIFYTSWQIANREERIKLK